MNAEAQKGTGEISGGTTVDRIPVIWERPVSGAGGDIAVAAAGIDRRIRAVAACISTPDRLRPGSDETPSVPDAYAWNCYRRCNPLTDLALYAHAPAIR